MNRKELVKVISEHFGVKAKYLAAPTFAYEIKTEEQTYTIDKEGKIVDEQGQVTEMRDVLKPREDEPAEDVHIAATEAIEDVPSAAAKIRIPLEEQDGKTLRNMLNMIYSKQPLINKSLELSEKLIEEDFITAINETDISTLADFKIFVTEIGRGKTPGITFDFLKDEMTIQLPRETAGAEELFTLIYKLARKQKHASYKSKPITNEKYTFRTWLLRLGMVGGEYKDARRELLKNLTGNGAFKGGRAHEA
ncbi:virulence-related protein [Proteinivorax tanatarense]|uniref:Virulence-related protein n=1 Tax=Proteinivorax tanatarense TaxID=1260629 RepID=A0AAU7VK49_9FIRM